MELVIFVEGLNVFMFSDLEPVEVGVPQDSVLGALLCLLMTSLK